MGTIELLQRTWCAISISAAIVLSAHAADAAQPPTFEADIAPILTQRCTHCHDGDHESKLDLRSHAGVLKGGKTGPAVTPGSLRESLAWSHLATGKMPADDGRLTEDQKNIVQRWITSGAHDAASAKSATPAAAIVASASTDDARSPSEIAAGIDRHIDAQLAAANIPASPEADDAEFHRRAHLDLIGRIPTAAETTAFLADTSTTKRAQLIDHLLASPEYGEHFAVIWHRLLLPRTAESYARIPHDMFKQHLATRFNDGSGWDDIVSELLMAEGVLPPDKRENREREIKDGDKDVALWQPAVSYIAIHNTEGRIQPREIAASSSRLFLGQSIECAQCHNHPQAKWTQADFWATAAFFARTRSRSFPGIGGGGEIREYDKGEQRIYDQKGRYYVQPAIHPEPVISIEDEGGKATETLVHAQFLDGAAPDLADQAAFRPTYARWVTSAENPYFARAAVNRLWGHLLGRGFVEPVDDLAEDNRASHPELLDELARELAASEFDLKHLIRAIMASAAYQRTSAPLDANVDDNLLCSHQSLKQMSAEVLFRSLCVAVPVMGKIDGDKDLMKSTGNRLGLKTTFLEALDEGDATPVEYTRGLQHALRLMNGDGKLFSGDSLAAVFNNAATPDEQIDRIYLAVLSRPPSAAERERMLRYVQEHPTPAATSKDRSQAGDPLADVYWVLLNSSEFMFNH